jgi:Uma2 family endonuclease
MVSLPEYRVTPDEYLRMERAAETKSEYDDGVIMAMSGASLRHNLIVIALGHSLLSRLGNRCLVLASEMKVRVLNPTRFFYPDVSVVCDRPQLADDRRDVLLNPLIVFEVLSYGTENYDRGRKFLSYQEIASLQEYVLVSQEGPLVERYRREADDWVYTKSEGLDAVVDLRAAGCEIPLREIYAQVDFSATS